MNILDIYITGQLSVFAISFIGLLVQSYLPR